ncbi:diacylglycerol/lipid kinase family protein [Naumannella cuiyingiana]|uniref:Diacylglycerol kinase family enzyme n=1 Tax=Naumannella cuiyingiana TaxID=1347891 RepID=A0A7Z0IKL1_9ACTN|nr:diacylglycerol kinase family protein [Naumannella cuiyingiana]NYI70700.1 diacylglycerol kinase family enzyme [Naumannella cuiyingiana]
MSRHEASAEKPTDTTGQEAAAEVGQRTRETDDGSGGRGQRAAIVYNPTKVELDVLKAAVQAAEAEAGWAESLWIETSEDDPGTGMAREAVDAGVDVVLAAGGDGTVRAVAEGLRGSRVALGLLPAGTGNLLARNLDLTLDNLGESVSTAFTGRTRDLDLGLVTIIRPDGKTEEHAFVVMAGMGLDAQLMENTDEDLKKKMGWVAYAKSMATAIRGGRRIKLMYRYDGERPRRGRLHTLLIGNCGSLPGNILLLPEAAVDDGILDVVALSPEGPLGWLQIWWKVLVENAILHRTGVGEKFRGTDKDIRALSYQRVETVEVRLTKPEPFELDGDEFGELTGFKVWVEQHGLRVRVPADS